MSLICMLQQTHVITISHAQSLDILMKSSGPKQDMNKNMVFKLVSFGIEIVKYFGFNL
jgi:hypothetical protein